MHPARTHAGAMVHSRFYTKLCLHWKCNGDTRAELLLEQPPKFEAFTLLSARGNVGHCFKETAQFKCCAVTRPPARSRCIALHGMASHPSHCIAGGRDPVRRAEEGRPQGGQGQPLRRVHVQAEAHRQHPPLGGLLRRRRRYGRSSSNNSRLSSSGKSFVRIRIMGGGHGGLGGGAGGGGGRGRSRRGSGGVGQRQEDSHQRED